MSNKLLTITIAALLTSFALAGTSDAEPVHRWLRVEGRHLDASDPALLAQVAKRDPTLLILAPDGGSATFHTVLPQAMYLRRLRKAAPPELATELIAVDRHHRTSTSVLAGR